MATQRSIVSITFSKPGVQPPVYLAGSFSDPPWQLTLMQSTVGQDTEHHFRAEVNVEEGRAYQYKFRVGEGDWILNEDSPAVTDDQGNRNNLLVIPVHKNAATKETRQESTIPLSGISSPSGVPDKMDTQRKTASKDTTNTGATGQDATKPSNARASGTAQRPVPVLVVDKTDPEPRHGDDFGGRATADQREAHRMRSLDADPDLVMVSDKAATDSANTAAEVADAATSLDIEQPTPPISDAEAGRIGLRRLSQTPITDVANVASEVSDSAALLDTDELGLRIEMPPPFDINDSGTDAETPGSGEVTPWEDRAPRFAHECVQLPQPGEEQTEARPPQQYERSSEEDEGSIDLNDPSIEDFPCDRDLILQRVRTSATRLSEDETVWEALSAMPATAANHQAERSESSSSPGRVAGEPRTPSLGSIPEENPYEEGGLSALPSSMLGARGQSGSEGQGNGQYETLAVHKEEPEPATEEYEPKSAAEQPGTELTQNTVPARTSGARIPSTTYEAPAPGQAHPASRAISAGQTMDGAHTEAESLQSLRTGADSSYQAVSDAEGYGDLVLPGQWSAVHAPPAAGTSTLTGRASPPATEGATSSAVEGSSSASQLTSRKAFSPAPPERPLTPTSIRASTSLVARSRALLRNFLRLVFVDWIAGVIRKLCGRGRRT